MNDRLPDFRKKVVSLSTADSVLAVEDGRFERQGGRLFVIGKVPKGSTKRDWANGAPAAVAWDAVTDYMIFESARKYQRAMARSRRKR